ncbi:hypothetical protein ACFTAO_12925 [Paenibacillus rhizoplanae]
MDSAVRILRKFVGSTLLVSTLLLLFNLILLGSLIFKETHQEASPKKRLCGRYPQLCKGLTASIPLIPRGMPCFSRTGPGQCC